MNPEHLFLPSFVHSCCHCQVENASRQHTILRTALKLQPFAFSTSPGEADKRANSRGCETAVTLRSDDQWLCDFCRAPVAPADLPASMVEGLRGSEALGVGGRSLVDGWREMGEEVAAVCHGCQVGLLGAKLF